MLPDRRPGALQRWQAARMETALDRAGGRDSRCGPGEGARTRRALQERYGEDLATWVLALGCATVLRSHLLARSGVLAVLFVAVLLAGHGAVGLLVGTVALMAGEWLWGERRIEVQNWSPSHILPGALRVAGGLAPAGAVGDERVRRWLEVDLALGAAAQEVFDVLARESSCTLDDLAEAAQSSCSGRGGAG